MSKIGIFMADGCEEIEGLTVVDIVRRAKMDIIDDLCERKKRSDQFPRRDLFDGRCGGGSGLCTHLTGSCCRAECREHCICSTTRR